MPIFLWWLVSAKTYYLLSILNEERKYISGTQINLRFQLGYSHSHWAYWLISHLFFFLPFQSPSEFRPVNIMTRNHTPAEHIPLPRAVAEPSPDTGAGSLLSKAPHSARCFESALQPAQAQPRVPLFLLTDTKRPELKPRTIQLPLNTVLHKWHSALHPQTHTTGYQASGYRGKYSTWKKLHLPTPAIHPSR